MGKKIAALLFVCFCFMPLQASGGDDLAKLGKARRDAAEKAFKAWRKIANNQPFSDLVYQLSVRWLNAELDLTNKKEGRVNAYQAHVERMKDWDESFRSRNGPESIVFIVIGSFQTEGEYWLAKERSTEK